MLSKDFLKVIAEVFLVYKNDTLINVKVRSVLREILVLYLSIYILNLHMSLYS